MPKTILFLGATGGVGFSTLQRSLAAGHSCTALCRTPSTLSSRFPADADEKLLRIEQGNAHDVDAVLRALLPPPSSPQKTLPDVIVFSIGAYFNLSKMGMDDARVCENGIKTVLAALQKARAEHKLQGRPRIVALSSTGVSDFGRDVPLLFVPLYHVALKVPHKDKKAMENVLLGSEEDWTVVRPSLFVDGAKDGSKREIRAGKEDPVKGLVESTAVGYTISREDVGRWIFENLIEGEKAGEWLRRMAAITY
ncbi:hypothetical protein QBC40DRAFT_289676 [Triangularia verruculosa]|uniref:NAD(P)-binding domain-containing protein n=1 Tax=Triangularia verruculosa TaxID=2587418 RepID=A0AAN7APZ2_9PEZI|nr:hypothetical protein QBC40DRAFT_289676 [Triangularia verruculosa]